MKAMKGSLRQIKTCIRSSAQKACLFARRKGEQLLQASASSPKTTVRAWVVSENNHIPYAEDISGIVLVDNGRQKSLMLPLTTEVAKRMGKVVSEDARVDAIVERENRELDQLGSRIDGCDLDLEENHEEIVELEAKQKQAATAELYDALYKAREERAAIEAKKANLAALKGETETRKHKALHQQRYENGQLCDLLRPWLAESGLLQFDTQSDTAADDHTAKDPADNFQASQAMFSENEAADSVDADAASLDMATARLQLGNAATSRYMRARALFETVIDGCQAHEEYEEWIAQKQALGQDVVPDEGATPVRFRTREETDQEVAEAAQAVEAAKAFARLIGHPLDDHDDESAKFTASDGADAASLFSRAAS